MAKLRLVHLALLLLISSSSAVAHGGASSLDHDGVEEGHLERRDMGYDGEKVAPKAQAWRNMPRSQKELNVRVNCRGEKAPQHRRRHAPAPAPAHAAIVPRAPAVTPAPRCLAPDDALDLARRQDDGQIQALSQQIQSISSVANSVSQASRQVSQSSQQLSQSVQQLTQSTSRLSQSLQEMQQSMQQAQQSARQADQGAQEASRSASEAIRAAGQSASAAMSASLSSASSSLIAAASASAAQIMQQAQSRVQVAQADATLARAEADNQIQVQRAQGAVLTVTQAALIGVGVFIGTTLLAILAFFLIMRHRRLKRAEQDNAATSYPRDAKATSQTSFGSYDGGITQPTPAMTVPVIGAPPPGANIGRAYSLFPAARGGGDGPRSPSSSTYSQGSGPAPTPSLQQWLKAGTVSPFGTLTKAAGGEGSGKVEAGKRVSVGSVGSQKKSPNWPFGVKPGQTRGSLPLRDRNA